MLRAKLTVKLFERSHSSCLKIGKSFANRPESLLALLAGLILEFPMDEGFIKSEFSPTV